MYNYLFRVIDPFPVEEIENELIKKGLKDIYIIQNDGDGQIFIGGRSPKKIRPKNALLVEENSAVNWEDQWALFSEDFKEGKAHINLSPFGVENTLLLTPGAGFGDLSHPTTYLMLEIMKGRVDGKKIVDIGTGSGILTLAAVMLGADFGIGIDIDKEAIAHAKKNAKLNHLESQTKFSKNLPKKLSPYNIFLMNMILPEQRIFDPSRFNAYAKTWIVSGILAEQKNEYLRQASEWGWNLVLERSKSEWIGFLFSN